MPKNKRVVETCPHCGQKLSPWQQVLLSVDRSLMCKNCWYRIVLDRREQRGDDNGQSSRREGE
jgi:DNA-directed RNA polymerase subunit RPC12/RpoP